MYINQLYIYRFFHLKKIFKHCQISKYLHEKHKGTISTSKEDNEALLEAEQDLMNIEF